MWDATRILMKALLYPQGTLGRVTFGLVHLFLLLLQWPIVCWLQVLNGHPVAGLDYWLWPFLLPQGLLLFQSHAPEALPFSLPFLWLSINAAVKRARDLDQSEVLAVLAIFPIAHIVLFLTFLSIPSWRYWEQKKARVSLCGGVLARIVPRDGFHSTLCCCLVGLGTAWIVVRFSGPYPDSAPYILLFGALYTGILTSLIFGLHVPRAGFESLTAGFCTSFVQLIALTMMSDEVSQLGAQFVPLWVPVALVGSAMGYGFQLRPGRTTRKKFPELRFEI